jgi:hypothetical protein
VLRALHFRRDLMLKTCPWGQSPEAECRIHGLGAELELEEALLAWVAGCIPAGVLSRECSGGSGVCRQYTAHRAVVCCGGHAHLHLAQLRLSPCTPPSGLCDVLGFGRRSVRRGRRSEGGAGGGAGASEGALRYHVPRPSVLLHWKHWPS